VASKRPTAGSTGRGYGADTHRTASQADLTVSRTVKEVMPWKIGPTPNAQSSVAEVTPPSRHTGSFTRQGMSQGCVNGTQTHHPSAPERCSRH
jgi:hypothetical protein